MTHDDDRGLAAVARVRSVRETDSRVGLQRVLAEEAAIATRLDVLHDTVAAERVPASSTPAELLVRRTALAHVGMLIGETRTELDGAAVVSADARARWSSDRSRLAAVEHLLEVRAARRRAEAERRAAREADDLAAQAWARGRTS